MNNAIGDLKIRFERYQSILSKKEEIEAEFNSWNELYVQAQHMIAETETVYNATNDPKDLEELNSWIDQNRDYLAVVMTQSKLLEDISEELEDCKMTEEQIEYMVAVNKHQILSDKMKEIEKLSKKKAKFVEPEYIVEVPNAEGRGKKIFLPLVEDYKKLAEEKRALSKVVRSTYQVVIKQIETSRNPEQFNNDESELTTSSNENSADNTVLASNGLDGSSGNDTRKTEIEAEMQKLREEMDSYKKASGRKCGFRCFGELIVTPRKYKGAYQGAANKYHKLQMELESLNNLDSSVTTTPPVTNNVTTSNEDLVETNVDKLIRLYRENYVADEYENIYSNSSSYNNSSFSVPNNDDYDIADDPQIQQAFNLVNKHHDDYVAKTQAEAAKKPKGFMKILSKKKPVDKEKSKDTIKRATIGIVSIAIVAGSTYLPGLFSKKSNNNENTQSNNDITTSQVGNLTEDKEADYSVTTPEGEKIISSTDSTNVEENEFIRLGDKFVIINNSNIYNTMYDAHMKREGLRPYFSADYERSVGGVAVNYEGQLYMFYSNDATAQENVDTLLANGGKITAVLGETASGYDGFYNIDDVTVLNKNLGGVRR